MGSAQTALSRLTNGSTPLDLRDGVNYDTSPTWGPNVPPSAYVEQADEVIPVNILGGGQTNTGARTLANLEALRAMLDQGVQAVDNPAVTMVKYQWCPPNAGAKKVWSAVVLDWVRSSLPELFMAAEMMGASQTIEGLSLQFTRRAPWVLESFVYDNILAGTLWSSDPAWTWANTSGSGTRTWAAASLPFGGSGYQQIAFSGAGAASGTLTDLVNSLSVTSGDSITVMVRVQAVSGGATTIRPVIRNAANSSTISTVAHAVQAAPSVALTDDDDAGWLAFNMTANSTDASAHLRFEIATSAAPAVIRFGEVLVVRAAITASDDRWHHKYSELTNSSGLTGVVPAVTSITFQSQSTTPSPLDIQFSSELPKLTTEAFGEGIVVVTSTLPQIIDLPGGVASAPWSTESTAANIRLCYGANVLRFTPSVANTWSALHTIFGALNSGYHFALFAPVRNNSLTTTFLLQAAMLFGATTATNSILYTRPVKIDPYTGSYPKTKYIALGEVASNEPLRNIALRAWASAASGSLDIDRIIAVPVAADTQIIYTQEALDVAGSGANTFNIKSNWLTRAEPTIGAYSSGVSHEAQVPCLDYLREWIQSPTVRVLWDGVSNSNASSFSYWRYTNTGAAAINPLLTLTRYPGADYPR